ncbi:MAG TPA: DNA/RNA nuclease SfsA, partial [Nitrospinaceae bacterium]|nr:DNA/RNA nuclease SfsA [Nitrospinaceae bacterium]
MKLGDRVVDGIFLERPNRYLARVEIGGQEIKAHIPDPGRLPGLMLPGRRVRLIYKPGPKRKTEYSLVLVRHGNIWVSVYPVFANKVVEKELLEGNLSCLDGYKKFKMEVKCGESRFDFQLDFSDIKAFVEVKSVSLVEGSVGKFPDAPTKRGVKHLKELI